MKVKDRLRNIGKYVGLGIAGGLALLNITKAQSTEYKKPLTEIRQEGDNIIIPSEKYNEFIKNYKPKNQTLNKTTDITLDGYITDALNTNPIEGIKITATVYRDGGVVDTYGPTLSEANGYYRMDNITSVNDQKQTVNIGKIEYYSGIAKISTNSAKKIKLTKYNTNGKQIGDIFEKEIFGEEEIPLQLNDNSRTITKIEIDGKIYTNTHIKQGQYHSILKNKNIEQLVEEKTPLKKITTVAAIMDLIDTTNTHHNYIGGGAGIFENNNPRRDFTLIPKINLETTITDPEYNIIPTIETIRDLIWYTGRVQGEWQIQYHNNRAWPIKLYIDPSNAPNNGIIEARNVIQYFQDSLGIHPDSLIQESQTEIPPSATNGITAAKIIWTDSTVLGTLNSQLELIFSGNAEKFIGANIYIDTNKVHGEDIGKYIAVQLQKYSGPGGPNPINNTNYLGYTTNLRIGQRTRPNNDEKKFIKIGRNSKPFYANKIYP